MDAKKLVKNAYFQAGLLIILLILYLISPNDSFRLVFGFLVAAAMIGLVVYEMKEGVKERGIKHELKDTLLALGIALAFWFGLQFIMNTSSPISAVVTCSMLPNLQRGDFAIVQNAQISAYSIEMTDSEFQQLLGPAEFYVNGTKYPTKGSLYSYCIFTREPFCKDFGLNPENYVETRGPFTIHYSSCTIDIRDKGKVNEPCVTSVSFKGKNYPINLSNDVIVYQPDKTELYSLYGDIIHRSYFKIHVTDTNKTYYLSKGDNNQILDFQVYDYLLQKGNYPISQDKLKGKLLFKVPVLGYYKLLLSGFFTEPNQCKMVLSYDYFN
jgi:signal peptidase I